MDETIAADKSYKNGSARLLEGIPISVKDNIDVSGYPTSAGCKALQFHVPQTDSTI